MAFSTRALSATFVVAACILFIGDVGDVGTTETLPTALQQSQDELRHLQQGVTETLHRLNQSGSDHWQEMAIQKHAVALREKLRSLQEQIRRTKRAIQNLPGIADGKIFTSSDKDFSRKVSVVSTCSLIIAAAKQAPQLGAVMALGFLGHAEFTAHAHEVSTMDLVDSGDVQMGRNQGDSEHCKQLTAAVVASCKGTQVQCAHVLTAVRKVGCNRGHMLSENEDSEHIDKGSYLGEQDVEGRRGGGGMSTSSSFQMSSGNRAGNSERSLLGEHEALGEIAGRRGGCASDERSCTAANVKRSTNALKFCKKKSQDPFKICEARQKGKDICLPFGDPSQTSSSGGNSEVGETKGGSKTLGIFAKDVAKHWKSIKSKHPQLNVFRLETVKRILCNGRCKVKCAKAQCTGNEAQCACSDGVHLNLLSDANTRRDSKSIINLISASASWVVHLMCYTVPKPGCEWKAADFYPQKNKGKLKELGIWVEPPQPPESSCEEDYLKWRPVFKNVHYGPKQSLRRTTRSRRRWRRRRGLLGRRKLGDEWGSVGKLVKKSVSSVGKTVGKVGKTIGKAVKKVAGGAKKWVLWKAAQKIIPMIIKKGARFHLGIIQDLLTSVAKAAIHEGTAAAGKIVTKEVKSWHYLKQMNRSKLLQWLQVVFASEAMYQAVNMFQKKGKDYAKNKFKFAAFQIMKGCAILQPMCPSHASLENHPQTTRTLIANTQRKWLNKTWGEKEVPPKELKLYTLRASASYFQDKQKPLYKWRLKKTKRCKRGSTLFKCENEKSKALEFVSCVDKWHDSKNDYNSEQTKLKKRCKGVVPERYNVWQGCLASFTMSVSRCTTCCCRNGVALSSMSTSLIYGTQKDCAMWFNTIDAFSSVIVTFWRAGVLGDALMTCSTLNTDKV